MGPHIATMEPETMKRLQGKVKFEESNRQVKVVLWYDIQDNPPEDLQISRVAMILHKSRLFGAILDLS